MRKKKLTFRVNDNGCFEVTSHRLNPDGYSYLYHNGRHQRAHRLVYQECFGELPDDLVVRHKCDNPRCINPEHLESGTPRENYMDAVRRGRTNIVRGSRNGSAKIDEGTARKIKILISEGKKNKEIMEILNVSLKIVRAIRENKTWRHVDIA